MHLSHELLNRLFAGFALAASAVACWVLIAHRTSRHVEERVEALGRGLAMEFARFLAGSHNGRVISSLSAAAPANVFWSAIETLGDNVAGDEWRELSKALRHLPHLARELDALHRGRVWRRALAAKRLGLLDLPELRGPLLAAMERGPQVVTMAAAFALGRMQDQPALVWLLTHPGALAGHSRHQLMALLKRFGPRVHVRIRRALHRLPAEAPLYLAGIEVLGLRRDRRARLLLQDLLVHGGLETRIAAARALGRIAAPASGPALRSALADPAWEVRAQAALAIGETGAETMVPWLRHAVRDPSWWVRRHAAYALGKLGVLGQSTLERLAQDDSDRYAMEMAREVLQALSWDRESPGGVTRVG